MVMLCLVLQVHQMMGEGSVASTRVVRGETVEKEHPGYRSYAQAEFTFKYLPTTSSLPELGTFFKNNKLMFRIPQDPTFCFQKLLQLKES